jgi:hypothetical protein
MALLWLLGAALLATLAGFLQGHQSVFWFYVALPVALGAVFLHVLAAAWPLRRRRAQEPGDGPAWRTRVVLGLLVGVLGFAFGASYRTNHLTWFGERVTGVVSETGEVCGVEAAGCHTRYRLTAAGDDLGWANSCGAGGPVGTTVEVDADPLDWIAPMSPACVTRRRSALVVTGLWLAGVTTIVLVRVGGQLWIRRRRAVPQVGV